MRPDGQVSKDRSEATSAAVSTKKPPQAVTASSEHAGDKSNVIAFRPRVDTDGPQGPDNPPLPNPSGRPCMYVLDSHVDEILLLARRGRDYRNIARTYGVSALEIWRIVTTALQAKRAA